MLHWNPQYPQYSSRALVQHEEYFHNQLEPPSIISLRQHCSAVSLSTRQDLKPCQGQAYLRTDVRKKLPLVRSMTYG